MELAMSKWKPGDLPTSVTQYGIHNAIWTDMDLAKFALIAFIAGVITGAIL
jgi:hypothetical protein